MSNRTWNYILAGVYTVLTIIISKVIFSYDPNFIESLILYYVILIGANVAGIKNEIKNNQTG